MVLVSDLQLQQVLIDLTMVERYVGTIYYLVLCCPLVAVYELDVNGVKIMVTFIQVDVSSRMVTEIARIF